MSQVCGVWRASSQVPPRLPGSFLSSLHLTEWQQCSILLPFTIRNLKMCPFPIIYSMGNPFFTSCQSNKLTGFWPFCWRNMGRFVVYHERNTTGMLRLFSFEVFCFPCFWRSQVEKSVFGRKLKFIGTYLSLFLSISLQAQTWKKYGAYISTNFVWRNSQKSDRIIFLKTGHFSMVFGSKIKYPPRKKTSFW